MHSLVRRGSPPAIEAVREFMGQAGLADLRGDRIDVIGDAAHLERVPREVEDAPRGPRIPVAWLTHGTGVHEESGPEPVDHREVRVTQDDERRAGRAHDRFVRGPGEDVFVVVPRAPMVHGHEALGHRAARPVLEVFQIADARRGEMDPRPADGLGRELVEPRRVAADRPAVVVSSNRPDMPLTQDPEHLVRPWIVADEVPGHPDPVRGDAIDVRKDGLEGGKIRVDVGEDREAHAATNELGLYHPLNKAGISRGLGDTMERFWPSTLNKVNITRERDSGSMAPPARQQHCFINFGAGPLFPSIRRLVMWCTALRGGGPLGGLSGPPKGRTVGSEWTKTEAADEAEAAATIAARVKCLMRCARTVAKPRRFRLNRTPRGLSTAEIVSQSAGRDGSKIENGKRSNLFPFELPTRRAAGAELVFTSQSLVRKSERLDSCVAMIYLQEVVEPRSRGVPRARQERAARARIRRSRCLRISGGPSHSRSNSKRRVGWTRSQSR